MNQNNQNSYWKKLLGFRNMQEELENELYDPNKLGRLNQCLQEKLGFDLNITYCLKVIKVDHFKNFHNSNFEFFVHYFI